MAQDGPETWRAELAEIVGDFQAWLAWEQARGARVMPRESLLSTAELGEIRGAGQGAAGVGHRSSTPGSGAQREAPRGSQREAPRGASSPARAPAPPAPRGGDAKDRSYRPPAVRIERVASPAAVPAAPPKWSPGSKGESAAPAARRPAAGLGAWGKLAEAPKPDPGRAALDGVSDLEGVREVLGDCTRCPLHSGRQSIVFGVGSPQARLVVIGEGPGANEDRQGEPFVGKAGQMLDRMLQNVLGLGRSEVYISNVVKCRPPGNRNPQADEIARCLPFLWAQLRVIQPEVVLVLGSVACRAVFDTGTGVTRLRGHWRELSWKGGRARAMPTFHPAYLLRNPEHKRKTFEDLLLVKQALS